MLDAKCVNRLLCCDCLAGMRKLPGECIPLTVTSPPYDRIRKYGGHLFDFENVARQLHRITVPGGIVVWVVQDQIIDGSISGTSFRQCLRFKEMGFRHHQTIVMLKSGTRAASAGRYGTVPEFGFVFSKGSPRVVNLIRDRRNKTAGRRRRYYEWRGDEKPVADGNEGVTPVWATRTAVWTYDVGFNLTTKDKMAFEHSALMPEAMAEDLIVSYSLPGDLVFDPFSGAGTTAKMAMLNGRKYLGMEIHRPFHDIALERLQTAEAELGKRLDEFFGIRCDGELK